MALVDRPSAVSRERRVLGAASGLAIEEVRCRTGLITWSDLELSARFGLVFVRRGGFMRRSHGVERYIDSTMAYFEQPGLEQQIAHPGAAGDLATLIALWPESVADLTAGTCELPLQPVFVAASVGLAHRALVARLRQGAGAFETSERVTSLVARVLDGQRAETPDRLRPGTLIARRRLVDATREALAGDPSLPDVVALGRRVGASPHHLSRIFHQETGETLTRYRRRLRIGLALERLADGERYLAALAADLGFADHAHLTRTLRHELGLTPSALRRQLGVQ